MRLIKPDITVEGLSDIDLRYWFDKGIRLILLDLDNTIVPWGSNNYTEESLDLVKRARDMGIVVILFSNTIGDRAKDAAWNMGIGYYSGAKKPLPSHYRKAINDMDVKEEETMAVGDQIFTDVLGGNLAGCVTVLVSPLSRREFSGTKAFRVCERLVGRKVVYRQSGQTKRGKRRIEHVFEKD